MNLILVIDYARATLLGMLIVVFGLTATRGQNPSILQGRDMNHLHQQIKQDLEKFHKDKSLVALQEAANRAESIVPDSAKGVAERDELRRARLIALLMVLAAVDEESDPSFDPSDVPSLSVTPPVVHGVVLDSGIDPKHVKDPQARKEYEQAIARNAEKSRRYNFQIGLRRIDDEVMGFVTQSVNGQWGTTEAGRQEIQKAVNEYVKNEKRKACIEELLESNPKP